MGGRNTPHSSFRMDEAITLVLLLLIGMVLASSSLENLFRKDR